jgi:hypothetical protein
MISSFENRSRVLPAVHGTKEVGPDPAFEIELSRHFSRSYPSSALLDS